MKLCSWGGWRMKQQNIVHVGKATDACALADVLHAPYAIGCVGMPTRVQKRRHALPACWLRYFEAMPSMRDVGVLDQQRCTRTNQNGDSRSTPEARATHGQIARIAASEKRPTPIPSPTSGPCDAGIERRDTTIMPIVKVDPLGIRAPIQLK